LATKKTEDVAQTEGEKLYKEWTSAWDALQPIRSTWDEKEQSLLAQTNDSVSGNITAARVSDAAMSTLAYERQARVAAQLATGRVYAMSKQDDKGAKLLNIVLNRYILPNANSQFDMLIKQRLWGLYASVYGSMPMMYDYRVDDEYIGPDCWLIDPRLVGVTPGYHSIQDAPAAYVSTMMSLVSLEAILKRKTTTYDKDAIKKLIRLAEGSKPSRINNSQKEGSTVGSRYDKSAAKDSVEIICKYENSTWTNFSFDYPEVDPIRKMDNPHGSGRKPVIMRHCFPLMNSLFGLGDFERGMKVQKAKDSIINLFLEGAKMRVYPPLKQIDSMLTPSTIRYQAGTKWKVKQMNAVEAMNFGNAPLGEFQATYSALQGMLQNMFGTSTTEITEEQGGPSMGKTPQALKMQSARENARDTWDRFMHEKATEELLEGMINLLQVKQEKPINFTVFEDDIAALGYSTRKDDTGNMVEEKKVNGLDVFDGAKAGKITINKNDLKSNTGYSYLIDANSSMKQDDEEQFQALMATWQLMHTDPMMEQRLAAKGQEYDEGDHLKKIFIAAGISDWEKILKEISQEKLQQMQQQAQAEQQAQAQAQQQAQMQQQMPMQDPMAQMGGMPQQQPMMQPPPQQAPQPAMAGPQFQDPAIAAVAQQLLGGM
jgi:hypothetical protein